MLSLIQKNLRPVQMCILCAVREKLTYICRVCLTKLSSVSGREDFWHYVLKTGYPLFQAGKSLSSKVFFILEMKVILCSCRQGSYPLFQAGKVSISC